ncbi:RHS repeat-associated core domain-containing protein [Prolixibacter sp. SD074]|uniref:RHS repeat-associated core domain-containing protein n=1 Tax=Prolixibacter sp. SD074 TaxID=2652391 RepID=UPI00126D8780|nr:RHS repeat-associated core domain-containing protein [Prolixibacter sp. SD074]GET29104.1 hypothetical protein SD074_13060 [Prolixibacter sp. SD074]
MWRLSGNGKKGYGFTYDGLNRLTVADYGTYSGSWANTSAYDLSSVGYDKNGNLNYDGIRNLTISYFEEFNLPKQYYKNSTNKVDYYYDGLGTKWRKTATVSGVASTTLYDGTFIYENGTLKKVLTSEGYYDPSAGRYYYYLKDHLGNTRLTFHYSGTTAVVDQEVEYYPFGSLFTGNNLDKNKYLYNGKELNDEFFENYDYGARFYDAELGRWHVVDPSADKYYSISPYAYCANNPMIYIDLTGMEFTDAAWEWVNKLIAEVNSRQESNNARIADKQAKLDAGGLSAKQEKRLNRQIGNLQSQNNSLEGVRGEVATTAASDQTYNVVESSSQNESGPLPGMGTEVAYTSFNFDTKNVDITVSPGAGLGLFAHELLHGYQFETGQISLGAAGAKGYSFLLDKTNEVAGYARQWMFGSNEGVTSISTLPERYSGLPQGPINVHNYSFQGRKLSDMNPYELQRLSKIMKQAYRYNGKTFY